MKYIWSPWRMTYIQRQKEEEKGCVFCAAQDLPDGLENLILHRGRETFVILNRFPYTSGHLMVVPYIHNASISGLSGSTRAELMELANQIISVLSKEYQAQGFNIGVNIGEAAGAGITDHVHLHVVPRWSGDTNFMSSLGETRVLPETLEDTYQRLKRAWHQRNL
ncbi:MAG: HIT domain-containing protein [Chloroflexota bacterium]|nr:MAG: HIT domain-containing protein [Chloroflexota bacterium]